MELSKTIIVLLRSWEGNIIASMKLGNEHSGVPLLTLMFHPRFLHVITRFYYFGKLGFSYWTILILGCSEFFESEVLSFLSSIVRF